MVVVSPKKVRTYSAHFSDPEEKNYSEGKFGGLEKKFGICGAGKNGTDNFV